MRQREDAHFVDLKQSSEATNGKPKVGYVVSAWPRLSETFILNEVIGVERLGVRLQIFTIKETEDKVPNAKASRVHAPVTCLSIKHNLAGDWTIQCPSVGEAACPLLPNRPASVAIPAMGRAWMLLSGHLFGRDTRSGILDSSARALRA